MISVAEASVLIHQHMPAWKREVFTRDLCADRDYPPFNRSMMDGIAVRFSDYTQGQRSFAIRGICPAGAPQTNLTENGSCLEIMTGAPVPQGADLVIPYEHLSITEGMAKVSKDLERVPYENIHLEGSDCRRGEIVLPAGFPLNGPHRGIAASMGVVPEFESSRILIISTGDELVEVTQTPLPHQIRRSNAYALRESLRLNGCSQVDLAHVNDDALEVAGHFQDVASRYDVLIYSGGVSKGKFDYLPNVWTDLGVTKYFHEVAQRPGKPLWFGFDHKRNTTVIGLPGNPVSSLVCLHRYFIPNRPVFAQLTEEVVFKKELTYFLPVKLEFTREGVIRARPLKIKNSGEFTALAGSDGFVELPAEASVFRAGEAFAFWPWRNF